ncbi:MAG: protein kinase domain-containing protein [Thermoguttaceae bacterium]|jgi:tetratricopeptide (TPR) repeat protein/tRNA A-37 threonylcarbamoyl transferase component Bud32
MIDSAPQRDPVEQLADEFAARLRGGQTPSIAEYAARHPQFAQQIERLFPTVALMEQFRKQEEASRRAAICHGSLAEPPPQLGDFEIIREIGRGGMGVVYEANQKSLDRRVAVKVLPRHALLTEKEVLRFRREAQTAARLCHTNIVPVFGVGEHDGLHYYVMPLVQGVGLNQRIAELKSGGSRPPGPHGAPSSAEHWRLVADVGIQVAEALAYAHGQGTLHRDIKPSNLLIDEHGTVCLADFGLARPISRNGEALGEAVGTLRYAAPEQLAGKPDARSDIYSVGLTLYELAALRPALDDSAARLGLSPGQNSRRSPRPRTIDPAIPRDLESIILKCLADDPERRYGDAAALADDLRRFREGRPIRARRASTFECAIRWCRRNPALAAVSALAAVLLVAVGITAAAAHVHMQRAYARTMAALGQAETTSKLALDVLDNIYQQLSPDRYWILSDRDGTGELCVCLGLRSASGSPSGQRAAMQVEASEETASLLEGLSVFYDRLAEQTGDDSDVRRQSAIAGRRVGDIRQRLGHLDAAEEEYSKAIAKLAAIDANSSGHSECRLELARIHNELGNIHSARLESGAAYASHQKALSVIQQMGPESELSAEARFELARTLYLLANKQTIELGDRRGESPPGSPGSRLRRYPSHECRAAAVRLLERLAAESPNIPDYRFFLALCLRPPGAAVTGAAEKADRQRAVSILEELSAAFPDVDDYRYELAATHAWVHVGLFPWQRPIADADAEENLRRALVETRRLAAGNPSIPKYACSEALLLAKLAECCRYQGRAAEAKELFAKALAGEQSAIARHAGLPAHHRVLLEFIRLKLAQATLEAGGKAVGDAHRRAARELVETCLKNLAGFADQPDLADDRLASAMLPVAYETLALARAKSEEKHTTR